MILPIIIYPDKILREKAREILKEAMQSQELKQLILDMVETMIEKQGIGLAAPQINKSYQLICLDMKELNAQKNINLPANINNFIFDVKNHPALIIINPCVKWRSLLKETINEGCLSIPGKSGKVQRPKAIKIKCANAKGEIYELKAKGLLARVLQHEIDHLEGVLFIDKLKN